MERVPDTYRKEYADDGVLVCMDGTSKRQTEEIATPVPTRPGSPEIHDFEHLRNGVSGLFMFHLPPGGWRRVAVTGSRKRRDLAERVGRLVDGDFPGKRVTLVMNSLNTHDTGSLHGTLPPKEAHRIASRPDIVLTPRHGSRSDMAENGTGVLSRQCLDRPTMNGKVAAWQARRNRTGGKVDWRFTTDDARIRLKSLYPAIQ